MGGKVAISTGTLTLADTVEVITTTAGFIMQGEGRSTNLHGPDAAYAIQVGSGANFCYNSGFRDLKVTGLGGFDVVNADRVVFDNIYMVNTPTCYRLRNVSTDTEINAISIINNMLSLFSAYGIYAPNAIGQSYFAHNTISAQGYYATGVAISLSGGISNVIYQNVFEGNKYSVYLASGRSNTVSENSVTHRQNIAAFYTSGVLDKFLNNRISYSTIPIPIGLIVALNSSAIVEGNTFDYTTQSVSMVGYNNRRTKFHNNIYAGIVGILTDDQIAELTRSLGPSFYGTSWNYPFRDIGTAQVYDISIYVNNLVTVATPTFGTWGTGWGYLTLNGSSQYCIFPPTGYSATTKLTGNRTIVWAGRPHFASTDNALHTFWKWRQASTGEYIALTKAADNDIYIEFDDGGGDDGTNFTQAFSANDKITLIVAIDDDNHNLELYFNGVSIASVSGTLGTMPNLALSGFLGRNHDASGYFDGDVSEWAELPRYVQATEAAEMDKYMRRLMGVDV